MQIVLAGLGIFIRSLVGKAMDIGYHGSSSA